MKYIIYLVFIIISCDSITDKNSFLERVIGAYIPLDDSDINIIVNNLGTILNNNIEKYTLNHVLSPNTAIYNSIIDGGYLPILYSNDILYLGSIKKDSNTIDMNSIKAYGIKTY